MGNKIKFDREQVTKWYVEDNISTEEIARMLGVGSTTIWNRLRKWGVEIKPKGWASRNFTDEEEARIGELYLSGYSTKEIMRMYGLSHHISISAALDRQGVERRSPTESNMKYDLNIDTFDVIDTEEKAYWWGFLWADGCVHINKEGRPVFSMQLQKRDKHHLVRFQDFIGSTHELFNRQDAPGWKITIGNIPFCESLIRLGIEVGRPNIRPILNYLPEHLIHHWVRGFMDGDGTVSAKPDSGMGFCGTYDILDIVGSWVENYTGAPVTGRIKKHSTAELYYLNYSGRVIALKVLDWIYEGANVWLERKRDRFQAWPQKRSRIQLMPSKRVGGKWISSKLERLE